MKLLIEELRICSNNDFEPKAAFYQTEDLGHETVAEALHLFALDDATAIPTVKPFANTSLATEKTPKTLSSRVPAAVGQTAMVDTMYRPYGGFRFVIGVPPVIIHFRSGFSRSQKPSIWGFPHDYENLHFVQ